MRNVFDQYIQPENRLTHALVTSLAADPALLGKFVRWVTDRNASPSGKLELLEQRLPGEEEATSEEEAERRGLPDAWIHDRKGWALIVESKIKSPLKRDQLERHRRVAIRREFSDVHLLALVVDRPKRMSLDGLKVIEWTELYSWLRREGRSEWARWLAEYMELLERKLAADEYLREGTLTVFAGIPFGKDNPYNYGEAKRTLRLAMAELRKRSDLQKELGMDPTGEGRPAITGRESTTVWDFLSLVAARGVKSFTKYPHLTPTIQQPRVFAQLTIPHGIKREFRRNLLAKGKQGFIGLFSEICTNFEECFRDVDGAAPWVDMVQGHFPFPRAERIVDAQLEFDLRSAFPFSGTWGRAVKRQPQWLEVVYEALSKKRSNIQLAVGVIFPYDRCRAVQSREILDHVANVWVACKPLIRAVIR